MNPLAMEPERDVVHDAARLVSVCLAWVLVVGVGVAWLQIYSARPGAMGAIPQAWPAAGPMADSRWTKPRLTMVIHPHCPCTRASITSLEQLAAIANDSMDIELLAYLPHTAASGWSDSGLLRAARRIPGLRVRPDPCGSLAFQLGAITSGHVFLHDQDQRLRFSGGMTPAREHEGPSRERTALLNLLHVRASGETPPVNTPVFGCPLREAERSIEQCCTKLIKEDA